MRKRNAHASCLIRPDESGKLVVQFASQHDFKSALLDLKTRVPFYGRRYDGERKLWLVDAAYSREVSEWAKRWFRSISWTREVA